MKSERSGVVGRILADRPVTTALAAAAGLVALAFLGVDGAGPAAPGDLARLLLAFLALPVAPLAAAAFAPKGRRGGVLSFLAAAAVAGGVWFALPLLAPALPNTDSRFFAVGLALFGIFLALRPALGAAIRFCFIGAGAAVLGVAGAAGAMAGSGAAVADIAALAAMGVGLAATVSVGVIADFSAFFARGVDARRAAIAASEQAIAPVALATALAFVSMTLHSLFAGAGGGLGLSWIAALSAGLAAMIAAAFSTGALSLSEADEMLAVDDNLRRQRLRRFWRPLRQSLSASAAYASVAILFIAALALAFDLKSPPKTAVLLFAPIAGLVAGLCYFSLRGGLIVATLMTAAAIAASWLGERGLLAGLTDVGSAVAWGVLATGYALLALSWRDARSPRLNARETMEAALTEGVGRFAVSMATAAGALYAAGFSGVWREGVEAAALVLAGGLLGGVLAPALMTALAALGGRERY